ncbi:formimidoylglutamate deiminase [Microbacterium kribbense]|uniref:Formimidoylglutamate deiminase n=1 Tax=Microbacterium kribbense TaxID=433645 RepID=A0ABP7GIS8_9MICO
MTALTSAHAAAALIDGAFAADVRITAHDGVITGLAAGGDAQPGDTRLGVVAPGFVNAHSHAFHRLLRGRTHGGGGDFWVWREEMYRAAASLTPDSYRALAEQVFLEMRDAGCTAVGEFHYVHHRANGTPYTGHAMELALADAAVAAGIRLVLLDACYLRGGVGLDLSERQRRFGDADAHAWLVRWQSLRDAVAADVRRRALVTVGAAVHSVRAVTPDDLAVVARELPADVPLHVHLSEQVAENDACLQAYGLTPTGLLAEQGLLRPTLTAVHATHLTSADIALLGEAGASIVMCPTTEADLGDGIGPAPELRGAGATLSIGSDQHAVIDPFEEVARLELDQRLRARRRGIFTPAQLWHAGSVGGARALGLPGGAVDVAGLRVGDPFDVVEIDADTVRTRGSGLLQLPLVARAGDVTATIVGGILTRRGPA